VAIEAASLKRFAAFLLPFETMQFRERRPKSRKQQQHTGRGHLMKPRRRTYRRNTTAVFPFLHNIATPQSGRKEYTYGIFQFRSRSFADPCNRAGRRSWYLGRHQSDGGLWK